MNIENPHTMSVEEILKALKTTSKGLSEEEVKKRLEQYGPNELIAAKKISPLKIFLEQFKDVLVIILLIATIVSMLIGEFLDASVIMAIVFACVLLGFTQEYRAEKALEALKKLAAPAARVLRNGRIMEIPAREVVPGDIVLIEAGDRIPADARLIEAIDLHVDEAVLTGESVPVSKTIEPLPDPKIPVADRKNMVFMGTHATYGRGKAVVSATGMNTEFGKIAGMLQYVEEEKTPLQERLEHVGKWLGILCLVVCFAVAVLGIFRGHGILEMFIWGVSLAVAAVPEALPAVVTISLAVGVQRMVKRNAIVRKLYAVETLGCVNVICADKTGTITKNEMTVREIYVNNKIIKVTGSGFDIKGEFYDGNSKINPQNIENLSLILRIGALCNNAQLETKSGSANIVGDPTEIALLVSAVKAGMDLEELNKKYPRIGEIPFDSNRKCMTTVHRTPEGEKIAYVKGAPEVILQKCSYIYLNGEVKKLTEEKRQELLEITQNMASNALRVLAMAYKKLNGVATYSAEEVEKDLIFVGLQGMIDPPRDEVIPAMELCKKAGIRVIMITGDHKLTAVAVAKEIGLLDETVGDKHVLTGTELDSMSDEEFEKVVDEISVYARVSPEHKVRIVNALKKKGYVVAMTGDGVNDAPAVKRADVGVAMGIKGTDVTKEASEMILADDNFATIVAAVEEGRGIYDNIKKYLMFLLSCNVGEILLMFVASLIGLPLPLLAIHILLINLTTDGLPAIALSVDPPDPDIMKRPPRDPKESIFTPRIKGIIGTGGSLMAIIGLPLFACVYARMLGLPLFAWIYQRLPSEPSPELMYAQTMIFWWMTLFEMFRAFACRSEIKTSFELGFTTNKYLLYGILSSIFITLLIIYVPALQLLFKTTPLYLGDVLLAAVLSITSLIVIDLGKTIANKGWLKLRVK
ncbi:MAG: calcium-transporting P-type ATPase, PMR1-type [Thermoprotei archaeon]|nr:MAG: calcium-transporting P-type ATPase, PMR1-type [Thermoprotei archaeon]